MVSGNRDNPPPSYPGRAKVSFFFFLSNLIQANVYIKLVESSRGGEERGGARGVRGSRGVRGGEKACS